MNIKVEFTNYITLVVMLLLSGCLPPGRYEKDTSEAQLEFLLSQGNEYWERRENTQNALRANFFFSKAAELDSTNQDLLVLLSRSYYFVGNYIETDPARKDSLFLLGAQAGRKALYLAPEFEAAVENAEGSVLKRERAALAVAPQKLIPAIYWWSANQGRYLATKPVIVRLDYQENIETALHRILALDPGYFYAAPYRFFGALYARTPGVELERSKEYFDLAVEKQPHYLGTYTLRAEFYHTKAGNREQFVQDLKHVITADPTLLPDVMPENLLEQEYARKLIARESMLFE